MKMIINPNTIWPGYAHDFLTSYPNVVVGWMLAVSAVCAWVIFRDWFLNSHSNEND